MVKMNHLVALLFALCLAIPLASATSKGFKYCDKNANYPVKVSGLDINPYPISRGKNTSFAISASTGVMLQHPLVRAPEIAKDPKEKQDSTFFENNKNEKQIQLQALKANSFS